MLLSVGVPVDPDRDQARAWLEEELARPGYQLRESFVVGAWTWVQDRLPSLGPVGALPAWTTWVVLGVVLGAVLAVLTFAQRDRWRRAALTARSTGSVLDEEGLRAEDYRTRATAALVAGDHDAALLDGYRAIAAGAVERTLLDDRPGRTAHEVALALEPVFPVDAAPLAAAADRFDAVRYGDGRARPEDARQVLDLGGRLTATRPTLHRAGTAPGTVVAP
ncbi:MULTISPECIES: DUF4129 domain-containing protein [unclassified Ornithinimicrobium]|uniref:DUF4129 domain-containing protein n=1 Tax=unclassified Ornithinimicrobium TaxID=2615080 RepID=UPI003852777E